MFIGFVLSKMWHYHTFSSGRRQLTVNDGDKVRFVPPGVKPILHASDVL
jgi:hypothetical protein